MLPCQRIVRWLMLSTLTIGLTLGCGLTTSHNAEGDPAADVRSCRVIDHDLGSTKVCGQPQKVVTVNAYGLDLLLSLDVQPAGSTLTLNVHQEEVFDNPVQQIPYLGDRITTQPVNLGNASEPSLEKLTLLKPDLIVGQAGRIDNYELLSQIAPTLLWRQRTAKGQWRESLRAIATALGQDEKAEAVIQAYESQIANARTDLVDIVTAHPKLLVLGANRLDEGFLVVNPDSYLGELLSGVGFELMPPPAAVDASNPLMSIEALPSLNDADTIIVLGWNSEVNEELGNSDAVADESATQRVESHQVQAIQQNWQTNGIAQSLTASQENRVYFATYYKWNGLNGPIGAELILEQLRQFFLADNRNQ